MEFKVYVTVDINCEDTEAGYALAEASFDRALDKFFDTISDDFDYKLLNLEIK